MPGSNEAHRSVTPLIHFIRVIMRGREYRAQLRYADGIAKRTQPPPEIPGGPNHKLSQVYYYSRDVRRQVKPPEVVVSPKLIEGGEKQLAERKSATPNKVYRWD